jgi:hypothetical protein
MAGSIRFGLIAAMRCVSALFIGGILLTKAAGQDDVQTFRAPQEWVDATAAMTDRCLHVGSNRAKDVAAAWGKEDYSYTGIVLTEADRLNGVTNRGWVFLKVPTKTADSDWMQDTYRLYVEQRNGVTEISPPGAFSGGFTNDIFDYEHWSCKYPKAK